MEDKSLAGGNQGGVNQTGGEKFEPMDLEPQKPSGLVTVATVIIVVAIIIIISNAIREEKAAEESEVVNGEGASLEIGDNFIETETSSEAAGTSILNADFLLPSEFFDFSRATRVINSTQGKSADASSAEQLEAGIVQDGSDSNIYYFATSSPNSAENFVGLYKYNAANGNWQRLHKETFKPDAGGHTAMLRVLGFDGDALVIMKDRQNRAAAACESLWLLGAQDGYGLFTLKADGSKRGLSPYQIPVSLRESEQEKVETCLQAK